MQYKFSGGQSHSGAQSHPSHNSTILVQKKKNPAEGLHDTKFSANVDRRKHGLPLTPKGVIEVERSSVFSPEVEC